MSISAINTYHKLYEESRIWEKNSWMGITCWKLPMDMMVIQELIVKQRPYFIIETGTAYGGSAAFYASICESLGEGVIITIDIENKLSNEIGKYMWSDRINFIHGNSVDSLIFKEVENFVGEEKNGMVILDSWHSEEHVYEEMKLYSKFVPIGGYMIVEDTHVAGNPVHWKYNDKGPMGAVNKWLEERRDEWEVDCECEKHLLSFNPSGYLKKIK